jgi:CRISPR/Cas system CSM-associated protein Csm3 (group 7 of RAMP superfamily)
MARKVYSCIRLAGKLIADSPLHVGGYGDDVDTDLPLARNGAGQWYVPGTSLAGALRQLAEQLFDKQFVNQLWGFQKGDGGHASFVVVEDAAIENSESVVVEIRDHVGIDREFGAAAEHIKYDRAILPRGTRLNLNITVEVPDQQQRQQGLAMLSALQRALAAGEVYLGAAKTRGLGQVKLTDAQLTEHVLGTRQGILAYLQHGNGLVVPQTDIDAALQAQRLQARPRLRLKIHWKPLGPLMVKAGFEGIASDMLPLVSGHQGEVSLVLPGSSVKGVLRNQAERIVRTVLGDLRPNWLGTTGRNKFLQAVRVPLIDELFGQAGQRVESDASAEWLAGLGALAVRDCFGIQKLTVAQWYAIQAADNDQQLHQALANAGLHAWSQSYHVAIDRWLGSAAESMLYTVLQPQHSNWEPLTLELNLLRLPEKLQFPSLALTFLLIRDLANNRLPLGFATHRGMGTVHVEMVEITGQDLPTALQPLTHVVLPSGQFRALPEPVRQQLDRAWQQWITHNKRTPV